MIRVAIADDHAMFADGIKSIFDVNSEIEVVCIASDGTDLLARLGELTVDVVLMDVDMPRLNGIETTKLLVQKKLASVVAVTMHLDRFHIREMIDAGALGYILKNTSKEELIQAVISANKGESYFSQKVAQLMMTKQDKDRPQLSKRELDVLRLICDELTTKEIAETLFISENTVETHRKNLMVKLNAKNAIGLVKYALKQNLV